jgi:hypothetical protein
MCGMFAAYAAAGRDYYKILGIKKTVSLLYRFRFVLRYSSNICLFLVLACVQAKDRDIKKAYHKMALKWRKYWDCELHIMTFCQHPTVLFCSVLFCSVLFCSVLFCNIM